MTFEPSTTTAAVTAAAYVGLLAGHWIGDYPAQRDADAIGKAHPTHELLAAGTPWHHGWSHLARHVASYLACQATALALIALVAPLTWPGVWTALLISGSTHAVIDRRWLVAAIVRLKRAGHWPEAPAYIDQALHHGALLLAAVGAARVTTMTDAGYPTLVGAALIVWAMVWERHNARIAIASRPAVTAPVRTVRFR
ncbi:hypothetical protein [Actinoplanes subglobosus]|uniref:DUF3307 domain-containing protein n=1 Tax=Actinoplanes subglobosus TaxID=1547892 RepID=A0ABV8IR91_9ACTN